MAHILLEHRCRGQLNIIIAWRNTDMEVEMKRENPPYSENYFVQLLCSNLQPLLEFKQLTWIVSRPASAKLRFKQEPPKSKFAELRHLRKNGMMFNRGNLRKMSKYLELQGVDAKNAIKPPPTEPDNPED